MLLDHLPCILIDSLVTLQRRIRREGVDDRRGRERHADRCTLQQPHGEHRVAPRDHVGEGREEN